MESSKETTGGNNITSKSKCSISLASNLNLLYTFVTRAKKFRGISILLAFTCHCKLLKNCINKNKSLAMTKSNEFLECMSFSEMKQIQNQVFTLIFLVHVQIALIIGIHMLLSYSSLCICKIIFIQYFSSSVLVKQLILQYGTSIKTTSWDPYLHILAIQFTNNSIYICIWPDGDIGTSAYFTFTNLHGLMYTHSTCLAQVFLPCATFKNVLFILIAFNKFSSLTIPSRECT